MEYALGVLIAAGLAYVILYPRWKIRKVRHRVRPFDSLGTPVDDDGSDHFMCIRQGDGTYRPGFIPRDSGGRGSAD